MNDNVEQPKGSEPLRSVVADAYRVFGRHRSPATPLDACLICCMSPELEREMRQWPLAKLTARHFYDYNTAAKSDVQPAEEILYLLPRMLELLAEGVEIHHSIELALDRLGRCPAGTLDDAEQRVLDRFALSYFERAIASRDQMWLDGPIDGLLMFDIGGVALAPMLDLWLQSEQPESTLQFVYSTYWTFCSHQDINNAFATDRPAFKSQIRAWMLDPAHRQRFADKLIRPDFQRLVEQQPAWGCIPFSTMVDAVFDQITQ